MRIELPERAVWPLPPRPLVLPWPLDSPWPSLLRRCLAPGRGLRSCKRIKISSRRQWFLHTQFQAAAAVNVRAQAKLLQRRLGRLRNVCGIFRAQRFAQYVFHAGRFQDRAHRLAGDDAGARRGRTEQHAGATKPRNDLVRNSGFLQRHTDHALARDVAAFADGLGDLASLAQAQPDAAAFVARHHQRAEAESAPALHHLGGAVDKNDLFSQLILFFAVRALSRIRPGPAATTTTATATAFLRVGSYFVSHFWFSWLMLKFQSRLAGRVGRRLHF